MKTGDLIKKRRKEIGLSAEKLAEKLGVSPATIYRYENGYIEKIPVGQLEPMAKALHTTAAYLMGWTLSEPVSTPADPANVFPVDQIVTLPLVASVRAGYDGLAEKLDGEMVSIPESMLLGYRREEMRAMRVKGNSMWPKICDGDVVIVHVQASVDSGDTAVMIYDGEEATIKQVRYVKGEDWLEMIPANPEYPPRRVEGADLQECRVFGKVIKLLRDV